MAASDLTATVNVLFGGTVAVQLVPPPTGYVLVTTRLGNFTVTAKGNHMAYTLGIDKFITVQVAPVDVRGNPAAVDGAFVWASSNEAMATVEVDPADSTKASVKPVGPLGSSQITATADADLGAGVREIIITLDLTTVAGEAVAGTINVVGDPQPLPPAP